MTATRTFLEIFIPLLVALDPIGLVPVFLSCTPRHDAAARRRLTFEAVGAAFVICLAFMFLGRALFAFLGIDVDDFRVAGGILLLVLAVHDLIARGKAAVYEDRITGIVPLATPLMAGPATLTTLLVLATEHGYLATGLSLLANFSLLLLALLAASRIARLVGESAMEALSKLVMILLAAIAVNFIRTGIVNIALTYRH
jgi:multiple antibiotic resistance protein